MSIMVELKTCTAEALVNQFRELTLVNPYAGLSLFQMDYDQFFSMFDPFMAAISPESSEWKLLLDVKQNYRDMLRYNLMHQTDEEFRLQAYRVHSMKRDGWNVSDDYAELFRLEAQERVRTKISLLSPVPHSGYQLGPVFDAEQLLTAFVGLMDVPDNVRQHTAALAHAPRILSLLPTCSLKGHLLVHLFALTAEQHYRQQADVQLSSWTEAGLSEEDHLLLDYYENLDFDG